MKRNILKFSVIFILAFTLTSPAMAENVLRWASQGDAVTFDPHSANMSPTFLQLKQVYEPLVSYNWKIEKEPYLAESWELVNPTTWQFKLRRGVTFHDGTPFNANAVAANLDRITDPETLSQQAVFMLGPFDHYEIIDDYGVLSLHITDDVEDLGVFIVV